MLTTLCVSQILITDATLGKCRSGYNKFTPEGVLGATSTSRAVLHRPYHISNHLKKKTLSPRVTSVVMAQVQLGSRTFYQAHPRLYTAPSNFCLKPINDRTITDVIIGFISSARVCSLHTIVFYRSPLELESRCLRPTFEPDFF